jgi:hypothetical protein
MGLFWSASPQICSRERGERSFRPPVLVMLIFGKVIRLTNPLGTSITSPLVFGSLLLTLTEDGRNLLTWDVSEKGERRSFAYRSC